MNSQCDEYANKAKDILKMNNQQTQISVTSLSNNGINIFNIFFQSVSSTMLLSEKWNHQEIKQNTVIIFVANRQTVGRGQKNNTWDSPSGNIYMTILARVQAKVVPHLQILVSSSIAQVIQSQLQLVDSLKLKWVNDIMIGENKVAGILVKCDMYQTDSVLQIGIGINVNQHSHPVSTCLRSHLKKPQLIDKQKIERIINRICIRIITNCKQIEVFKQNFYQQYNKRLAMKNQSVVIYDSTMKNITHQGKFIRVAEYGFAQLEIEGVGVKQISDGRMRRLQ